MIGLTAGGILNLILDPVFIFACDMGISGAALATVLSQLVSFCLLFQRSWSIRGTVPIRPKNFTNRRRNTTGLFSTADCLPCAVSLSQRRGDGLHEYRGRRHSVTRR